MHSLSNLVKFLFWSLVAIGNLGHSYAQSTPTNRLLPDNQPGTTGKPIQVFILMGQSNMIGMGDIGPDSVKGTLTYLTRTETRYPWLVNGDKWTQWEKVYYYDARVKKGAPLSPTANNGKTIGPELGFGYVMGQVLKEPILINKSCIGNRSLGWDLLPPGSKQYTFEGKTFPGYKESPDWWIEGMPKREVKWYAGKQYDDDMTNAKMALKDIAKWYPSYKDQGYEIAGFVWWQGGCLQRAKMVLMRSSSPLLSN